MTSSPVPSTPSWRNRITGHAAVLRSDLVANPENWPTHPADQQLALVGALAEVGWVAEVLVNRTTGHLVDGHLRVELTLAQGEPTVPAEPTAPPARVVPAVVDAL